MKFLPIAVSNVVSLLLLIFFNYVCRVFKVQVSDIFLPFIILQIHNFGLFNYYGIIFIFRKKDGLKVVNLMEISYLILKAYCVMIYLGIFIFKFYLNYYYSQKFHMEEVLFVCVIFLLIYQNANEFYVKHHAFKNNVKFEVITFEQAQICPICWETTNEGIQTNCQHYFH